MACGNASNQSQISLPLHCNAYPALFNGKEGSISFLPRPLLRNESNMIQDLYSPNHQVLANECRMIRYPCPVTCPLPGRKSRMILGSHFPTKQLSVNGPNILQNSNLLQYQLSSNRNSGISSSHQPTSQSLVNRSILIQHSYLLRPQLPVNGIQMTQDFHPVADQLAQSNIPKQSSSLVYQLPPVGICMNKNSNIFIHQPSRSTRSEAEVERISTHVQSQSEFSRNLSHQQPERESTMRQGLHSIFQPQYQDTLSMLQSPCMTQQIFKIEPIGSKSLYPSSNNFTEMGFNKNQDLLSVQYDLPISDISFHQNLHPQYSENVHICVVGPPGCGKADLIRAFARNDKIRIPADKPFRWVVQQGMVSFGTILNIDIWYVEDLIPAFEDLRSHSKSSKSVVVLVYSVAQRSTLLTVHEWIKLLKSDIGFNVPIMLVGNNNNIEFSNINQNLVSYMDGVRLREEYGLSEFYECSTENVNDVEAVFLFAAHKAFHRTI